MKPLRLLAIVLMCGLPGLARADSKLPPWFPTQGIFSINPDNTTVEDYGRGVFPVGNGDAAQDVEVHGHHWTTSLYPTGATESWSWNGEAKWKAVRPLLEKQGWKVVHLKQDDGNVDVTLRRGEGAEAAYLHMGLSAGDPYSNSAEIVEPAPPKLAVTLKPPAKKPEVYGDKDNFPFVTPLPGAKLTGSEHLDTPMDVTTEKETEPHLVGTGQIVKHYQGPEGLSNLAFVQTYASALEKAGWTITRREESRNNGNGIVQAHYAKNGRDIWLDLTSGGTEWSAKVADVGTGLRAALQKSCKVAIYGVNFDFDKATLRKDAEPVLLQVLALFRADPRLSAEIGGHTDNVGQAAYNQTLSQQRAEAVKAWLVKNGIAASRLTARGYGDSVPLAPNDTAANRARNRRVELKKPDCRG